MSDLPEAITFDVESPHRHMPPYPEMPSMDPMVFDVVPLVYNDNVDTSAMTNVLLIDDTVQEYQQFVDGCNATTFPIVYNYHSDRNELKELLARKFSNIERIAFVFHNAGMNGKLFLNNQCFFKDSEIPENFSENVQVLVDIIRDFGVGHVDYLACNSLDYDNWKQYYGLLKTTANVVIGASNDATGNIKYGGDWVMESTSEDIKTMYFNDIIDEYTKTLDITTYTYDIIWSNTNNLADVVATGSVTFTSLDPTFCFYGFAWSPVSNISAFSITYNGNTYSISNGAIIYVNNFHFERLPNTPYVNIARYFLDLNLFTNGFPTAFGLSRVVLSPLFTNIGIITSIMLSGGSGVAKTIISNFSVPSPKTFRDVSFTIQDPSSNSPADFSYNSSNPAVATINGNRITIVGAGATTIRVSQAANSNYTAGYIDASLVVNKATPQLSNFTIPSTINEHTQIQLSPPQSTNPSGEFTYTNFNNNVATIINNNTLQILSKGITTITATQLENTNYYSNSTTILFDTSSIHFPSPSNILPNHITGTSEPNSTIVVTETTTDNETITTQIQSDAQGIWDFNVNTHSNNYSFAPLNANQFSNSIQSNYNMKYHQSIYSLTVITPVLIKPRQNGINPLDQRSWRISPKLPTGLKFSSISGIISGTPTQPAPSTRYNIWSNSEIFLSCRRQLTIEIV